MAQSSLPDCYSTHTVRILPPGPTAWQTISAGRGAKATTSTTGLVQLGHGDGGHGGGAEKRWLLIRRN